MKTGISHINMFRQPNAFSNLLLRTLLAALVIGNATALLLTLGVFGLTFF
jgi:hypothetical protein